MWVTTDLLCLGNEIDIGMIKDAQLLWCRVLSLVVVAEPVSKNTYHKNSSRWRVTKLVFDNFMKIEPIIKKEQINFSNSRKPFQFKSNYYYISQKLMSSKIITWECLLKNNFEIISTKFPLVYQQPNPSINPLNLAIWLSWCE